MNISTQAYPVSTIDEIHEQEHDRSRPQNVGNSERLASAAVGACMTLYGLARGSLGGALLSLGGAALFYRGWTGQCSVYKALGINSAARRHAEVGVGAQRGRKITHSMHINRSPDELYNYWRKLENLPQVLNHLKSVEPVDERRSRWTAYAPGGRELEWEAEIITDKPGEIIAWQSLANSEVDTAGSVRFARPLSGEGTDLRVSLKYDPPGGRFAEHAAHLFGRGLGDLLDEDLRRFKQLIETGEISTNAMQPAQQLQTQQF